MTPDLLSLVLDLRFVGEAGRRAGWPRWWGRAGQALLLDVLRAGDAALAADLHEEDAPRPYTVSTLLPVAGGEGRFRLRLTALEGRVAGPLRAAAQPGGQLAPGSRVELDFLPFDVLARPEGEARPWEGESSYEAISARFLLGQAPPARQVSFRLSSPAAFKSQGRHVPLPLPGLLFGSLLQRWNAFAPVAFPEEVKRYAEECLAVSRYDLASRPVEVKAGGRRVGAVGRVTFTTLNYDRYWMSLIHVLAGFALYSGIGVGTTMGLGQARQVHD
jgi:CRISPR-associated endoribonuclease Cas6